jgi:hypothetical protein
MRVQNDSPDFQTITFSDGSQTIVPAKTAQDIQIPPGATWMTFSYTKTTANIPIPLQTKDYSEGDDTVHITAGNVPDIGGESADGDGGAKVTRP